MLKVISIVGLVVMIGALIGLYKIGVLLTAQPIAIALQLLAVALMVSARVTFGRRSFHAAANPTAGGLVTTGPYRIIRHPIYAAVLYFMWAAALVTIGALVRMYAEENLLVTAYPDYAAYRARTARVIPFVL